MKIIPINNCKITQSGKFLVCFQIYLFQYETLTQTEDVFVSQFCQFVFVSGNVLV